MSSPSVRRDGMLHAVVNAACEMSAQTLPHRRTPACPALPLSSARARAEALDGQWHAMMAPLWGGLSPISMALAVADWAWHLGTQPARSTQLVLQAWQLGQAAALEALTQATLPASASERPDDQRFTADAWQRWPWNAMARQHLGTPDQAEAWLETQGVTRGTWAGINVGWVNRMATNEAVRTRYGVLYSQS